MEQFYAQITPSFILISCSPMTGYQVDLYIATHETAEISDDLSLRLLQLTCE